MAMDAKERLKNPHPRASANIISALTFWWTTRIFIKGYKRELEVDDLYDPLEEHESGKLGDALEKNWEIEKEKCRKRSNGAPSLSRAMWATFGCKYLTYGLVLMAVEVGIKVAQPLLLGKLISYFAADAMAKEAATVYAVGVILCSGIAFAALHPYMLGVMHIGMQMRVAACSLLYRKTLKLSQRARSETSAGQATNLMSNDVNRLDIVPFFMHYLWVGPMQTALCSYLMWHDLGASALIGVAVLLLTIPLQGWLGKKAASLRLKTAQSTDARVKLMSEIIGGIQVIKMYTWEEPFAKLVAAARRTEVKQIMLASYVKGICLSCVMFTTRISVFATVVSFVLFGNELSAEKVFVMISYYNIIRQTMTVFFPVGITQVAEGTVTMKRLQEYMMLDEISPRNETATSAREKPDSTINQVSLVNATAKWNDEICEPTLSKINATFKSGQLVAVVGPVGAGKTSLVHAILSELPLACGSLEVRGRMSYAAQEPWLFAGSVRQNIVFGDHFNEKRYLEVVRVCALERDLAQMPFGDETRVGDRGVTLSGGQRARISLARAVYKDADIYLLDDPLSAVDANVGQHLFSQCITGFLEKKAVLLVTHQLQFLASANEILVLKNGAIEARGSLEQLKEQQLDFTKLLASGERNEVENTSFEETLSDAEKKKSTSKEISKKAVQEDSECRSKGTVAGFVYSEYFKAGGNACVIFIMFLMFALAQTAGSCADYWLTIWMNHEDQNNTMINATLLYEIEEDFWSWMDKEWAIYIYTGIICATLFLALFRSYLFFNVCMSASVNLHNSMFSSIIRTTVAFFSANPTGRILNRFSKDVGAMDEILPSTILDALQIGLTLLGTLVVVIMVNYWMVLPTLLITVVFYALRGLYLRTSRSVKRLEGVTRSPVFSHLAASIGGATTVRALGAEPALRCQFDAHQDLHSAAWYLFISSSRAFGYWLDAVCFFYIGAVTAGFLLVPSNGAAVGLAITQALGLTGVFQWGMRQSAEMENQMTSVERVLEFSQLQDEEPNPKNPNPKWPTSGGIKFQALSLKYKDNGPDVLSQVDLTIDPGAKIGIVGRTGAGKSSLVAALFRLAKISEGQVAIDGVDTRELSLRQLRASVAIIPQQPVLFAGTMRKNLDPFGEFADDALWGALEQVDLKQAVADLPGGLGARMQEGGANFSVGQRQLVCLARAIVRNAKILVLDEATANVDSKTDSLIQRTIRAKFAACTVLTIAHRLDTVLDSDKVVVMDAGRVAEFDAPARLLAEPNSLFATMAQQAGLQINTLHSTQK